MRIASHCACIYIFLPFISVRSGLICLSRHFFVTHQSDANRQHISVLILPLAGTPSLSRLTLGFIKSRQTATWNADTETRGNGGGRYGVNATSPPLGRFPHCPIRYFVEPPPGQTGTTGSDLPQQIPQTPNCSGLCYDAGA